MDSRILEKRPGSLSCPGILPPAVQSRSSRLYLDLDDCCGWRRDAYRRNFSLQILVLLTALNGPRIRLLNIGWSARRISTNSPARLNRELPLTHAVTTLISKLGTPTVYGLVKVMLRMPAHAMVGLGLWLPLCKVVE